MFSFVHAGAGAAGYFALNAWAVGFADSGGVDPGPVLSGLRATVDYVLLQPLAYWALAAFGVDWWTWRGLALLVLIVAVNSVVVAGVLGLVLSRFRARA